MKITNISTKINNRLFLSHQHLININEKDDFLEISCLVEDLNGKNKKYSTVVYASQIKRDNKIASRIFLNMLGKIIDENGFLFIESIEI